MKKYFEALLLYMGNLKCEDISTELTMDGRYVDYWDQEFIGLVNGLNQKINLPKQFIKLFDTLLEKYGDEIWDGSQNDEGSEWYRVRIDVYYKKRSIVITSEIEITTEDGAGYEIDVSDNDLIQSFLRENEIDFFSVKYNGGGDSGEIEESLYDENGNEMPNIEVNFSDDLWEFLEEKLDSAFGGWEINEGSVGTINVDHETLSIDHTWFDRELESSELEIVITQDDLD